MLVFAFQRWSLRTFRAFQWVGGLFCLWSFFFLADGALAATETIPDQTRKSNYYSSNDYVIEAGGCFHVIPSPSSPERVNAWFSNNFQIAGPGYHYFSNEVERQEDSGAIRICINNPSQTPGYVSHAWFAGTITLGANATIGIQQNDGQKNCYLNSLAANDASYVLTLSPAEATDTVVILGSNESFTNPVSILKSGTVQVGKIDSSPLTLHDQANTSVTHTVNFDGTAGSLGSGTVTIASSSATLRWQRTGSVEIANTLSGSGKLVFDGDARYSFSKPAALTGMTGAVTINSDASVKLYGSPAWAQTNSSVNFTGTGTLILGYDETGNQIQYYSSIANVSGFTGTLLMADGYRWNFGPGDHRALPYRIGATDGGQIFLSANGNYLMTLNVEGIGRQGSEALGAIRMIGQSDYQGAMTNLGGTVYLTDDARISAGNTPKAGNGVSSTHNQGMISANLISQDSVSKAALRVNGNAFNGTWTHLILTGSANDYGKTFIESKAILQVGYSGMVNGSAATNYDGTTGSLGSGDVLFTSVDGTSGSTADLGGKLIFARTNDCVLSNAFLGKGTIQFTAGGNYSLTNAAALTDFTGALFVEDGTSLTLAGQSTAASVTLNGGALLGIGTLTAPLTMNSGTLSSEIALNQSDLAITGTFLAQLDGAQPEESLTSVSGKLDLTDGSTLKLLASPELLKGGETFFLLEGDASSFAGLDLSSLIVDSDQNWKLSLIDGTGGTRILGATLQLPEPSTLLLLFLGLLMGLGFVRPERRSLTRQT